MTIQQLVDHSWRLFWAGLAQPWALGLLAALIVIILGFSFALHATFQGISLILRFASAIIATIMLVGVLEAMGVDVGALAAQAWQWLRMAGGQRILPTGGVW